MVRGAELSAKIASLVFSDDEENEEIEEGLGENDED